MEEAGVRNVSLSDFNTAAEMALERGLVDKNGYEQLMKFIEENGR